MVWFVMSMVRVLQVMDRLVVPLVMHIAGEGAVGDAVGDGAVGDVDGGVAAGDITGDGDANVADREAVACDETGGGSEGAAGNASGGDGLLMPMVQVLSVM